MAFSIEKFIKNKTDLPMKQMLNVIVIGYGTLESGAIAISSKMTSAVEVDEEINKLISELESIREQAKKVLT
jgi:hypothetical protein